MTTQYLETLDHLINGVWAQPTSGESQTVVNPATNKPIGKLGHASRADLDSALAATQSGFNTWRRVSAFSVEEAYDFARTTGLGLLAAIKEACGSLDKVEVIKVLGMVNASAGFTQHPQVINGCLDLFVAVLGENGRHARSAVGMGSLPANMPVEIECIVRKLP